MAIDVPQDVLDEFEAALEAEAQDMQDAIVSVMEKKGPPEAPADGAKAIDSAVPMPGPADAIETELAAIIGGILARQRADAEAQIHAGQTVDLSAWQAPMVEALTPLFQRLYHRSGQAALQRIVGRVGEQRKGLLLERLGAACGAKAVGSVLSVAFDVFNPRVLEAINALLLDFCRATLETASTDANAAVAATRQALAQGLQAGETGKELTERLANIFSPERAFTIAATECLTGDNRLHAANLKGVYRRYYRGTLFKAIIEGGQEITGTRNHPVLTRRGWVSLGCLQEDDYLVCNGLDTDRSESPGREENDQAPPPSLHEVFETLASVSVVERIPMTPNDFHGDGSDGDVDILTAARLLRYGNLPSSSQLVQQLGFIGANSLGSVSLDTQRDLFGLSPMINMPVHFAHGPFRYSGVSQNTFNLSSIHGVAAESFADLPLADSAAVEFDNFLDCGFGDMNFIGTRFTETPRAIDLGDSANRHVFPQQGSSDCVVAATKLESQCPYAKAVSIKPRNFLSLLQIEGMLENIVKIVLNRVFLASKRFADLLTRIVNSPAGTTQCAADLRQTKPAPIHLRRLKSLQITEDWHGYVYNLDTLDGYYDANGIITKNCSRAVHAGQVLAAKESGIIKGKRWLASSDACDKCLAINGKEVGLDEPFFVEPGGGPYATILHPPYHPRCFCAMEDVLADEFA